jgi:hypothetical protein
MQYKAQNAPYTVSSCVGPDAGMLVMLTLIQNSCPLDVFWTDSDRFGGWGCKPFQHRSAPLLAREKVHGARSVDLTIAVCRHDALEAIFKSQMQGVGEKPDERAETADLALIRIKDAVERRGGADARDADVAMFPMAARSPLRSEERGEHLQFVLDAMTNLVLPLLRRRQLRLYRGILPPRSRKLFRLNTHEKTLNTPKQHFHAVTVYGRTASLTSRTRLTRSVMMWSQ